MIKRKFFNDVINQFLLLIQTYTIFKYLFTVNLQLYDLEKKEIDRNVICIIVFDHKERNDYILKKDGQKKVSDI